MANKTTCVFLLSLLLYALPTLSNDTISSDTSPQNVRIEPLSTGTPNKPLPSSEEFEERIKALEAREQTIKDIGQRFNALEQWQQGFTNLAKDQEQNDKPKFIDNVATFANQHKSLIISSIINLCALTCIAYLWNVKTATNQAYQKLYSLIITLEQKISDQSLILSDQQLQDLVIAIEIARNNLHEYAQDPDQLTIAYDVLLCKAQNIHCVSL